MYDEVKSSGESDNKEDVVQSTPSNEFPLTNSQALGHGNQTSSFSDVPALNLLVVVAFLLIRVKG